MVDPLLSVYQEISGQPSDRAAVPLPAHLTCCPLSLPAFLLLLAYSVLVYCAVLAFTVIIYCVDLLYSCLLQKLANSLNSATLPAPLTTLYSNGV